MPTYEYECQKCGKVIEVFHGMTEEGPKKCTKKGCNGKLKKLISAGSGLIFKGSGFYITDYKDKGGADKAEKKDSESKTDSKSDSKSETKSDSKSESKKSESKSTKSEKSSKSKSAD